MVSSARRKRTLRVFMNNAVVGTLTKLPSGALQFEYNLDWVNSDNSVPLSLSLPLSFDIYSGDVVINYFDNLLPDNEGIRKALARRMSLNSQETFDILSAIGRDCVGAVQLLPIEEELSTPNSIQFQKITNLEISKILKGLKSYPLGMRLAQDFRISIAGVQEKTAFLKVDGKWSIPQGNTPSSHIFKTQMGMLRGTIDMKNSVENEWLCMQICKAFNLPTAVVEIEDFEDIRALVVERFDREYRKKNILRTAQEDFCQAFGIPSHKKYENEGGPGVHKIMELLSKADNPMRDKHNFLKSQVVFWLLAAVDGHAKNFSAFLVPGGINLTPLYDVVSAHPPIRKKQIAYKKAKLAMAVGTNRHYRIDQIKERHWLQVAQETKFPNEKMEEILHEVIGSVDKVIATVSQLLPKDFPQDIARSIFEGMRQQTKRI